MFAENVFVNENSPRRDELQVFLFFLGYSLSFSFDFQFWLIRKRRLYNRQKVVKSSEFMGTERDSFNWTKLNDN